MEELLTKIFRGFKKYFITGLLLILPLWITTYAIWLIMGLIGSLVSPILKAFLTGRISPFSIRILSFFVTLFIIWIIGAITANILGKKILFEIERLIIKMPVVKEIYSSAKTFIKFLTVKNVDFKAVVFIEFPRKGVYAVAFVTNDTKLTIDGKQYVSVFYPTTPNPTTGFYMLIPEEEIIFTSLKIDEAVKMIISGGVLLPQTLEKFGRIALDGTLEEKIKRPEDSKTV